MDGRIPANWYSLATLQAIRYRCGYCDAEVGADRGYYLDGYPLASIRICPLCNRPTFFEGEGQNPGVAFGRAVPRLPPDVDSLYKEARVCSAAGAHTSAVLAARKVLMHIAVAQGAKPGLSFVEYVEFLASQGFVPPHGRGWVDHIRKKSNEANHEIVVMGRTESEELLTFLEMLLKFIYEFPSRIPQTPKPSP